MIFYRPGSERDACGTGFVSEIGEARSFGDRVVLDAGTMAGGGIVMIGSEETCPRG